MKKLKLLIFVMLFSKILYSQNAEKILEIHIKKTGGEEAWSSLNSIILNGETIINLGESFPIVIYHQRPYYKRVVFTINGKEVLNEGYDGKKGWTYSEADKKNIVLPNYRPDAFDSDILMYKQKGFKVNYLGEEKYDKKNSCYKIELKKNENTVLYCIDRNSYEIVKEKNGEETLYYSNFKRFNGLSFATRIIGKPKDGGEYIIKLNDIKINPQIDKKKFKF